MRKAQPFQRLGFTSQPSFSENDGMSGFHDSKFTPHWLSRHLRLDPCLGQLIWVRPLHPRIKRGSLAGTPIRSGEILVRVNKRSYKGQDLAWFLLYGRWPCLPIGFKNGNRCDLKPENLYLTAPAPSLV